VAGWRTNVAQESDMPRTHPPRPAGVFIVVFAYALFAGLWILMSDRAMGVLFSDPAALVQVSMVKGWFFVAVTSLLLYVLVRRLVGQLDAAHQRDLEHQHAQKQAPPMLVAIAEASPDAIFAKDEEGRYLLFNNAAAHFVGKPAEAVIGQDDRAIFPPEQAERIMASERQIRETGQNQTIEEVAQTIGGPTVFLSTRGPLRSADGRIFGTFGISRDITERKRAEDALRSSNATLQKIVDNDVVGIMFWDTRAGRLTNANDAFMNLVGFDRSDMESGELTWQRLTPPEYHALSQEEMVKLLETGRIGPYQKEYFCKDGSRRWLLFAGSSLGADTCVEFCIDIAALKAAETELHRRNAELEHLNRAAIDRELRMIALKREVNAMARAAGRPAPYDTSFADTP